jgi:DNA primase
MNFDIGTYVTDNLGQAKKNAAGEWMCECPWCGKFGGFYVNSSTGNFVCFKCDERGRHLVGVIAQVEGITFNQAQAYLMKNTIKLRRKETVDTLLEKIRNLRPGHDHEDEPDEYIDVPLPREFIPVFNPKKGRWSYPHYLKGRRISRATAKEWGLGWCRVGQYASRIVFPVECPRGRSFVARDATDTMELKIKNPPGAQHGSLLIGWPQVPDAADIVLVEGPFDAIKLWQHGIYAMGMFGKVLHSDQLKMLFDRPKLKSVVIMLDPEETVGPYEIARQLMVRIDDVSIARLPQGVDPGASTKKQAWKAFENSEEYDGNRTGLLLARLAASRQKIGKIFSA